MIKKFFTFKFISLLVVIITIIISIQQYYLGEKSFGNSPKIYKHYNNYIIFKNSFKHLIEKKDLYKLYPKEQWDLYKYTPTFSLFFGIFYYLPDIIGLILWNLLNTLTLLYAIKIFPNTTEKKKLLFILIILLELIIATQNEQSNALLSALFLLTFINLENKNYLLSTLFIVMSIYIKLFGIVFLSLFLLYPEKLKSTLLFTFWFIIFAIIPIPIVGIEHYLFLMKSYYNLLTTDHSISYGYSIMGILHSWFGIKNKLIILIIGITSFILPLLKFKNYKYFTFRVLLLSSALIWVVIFNHKAESPTFIISMVGSALWFISTKQNRINTFLIVFAIIFTSIAFTDLFPKTIRENFIKPYSIKALPMTIIWGKIIYEMLFHNFQQNNTEKN